MKLCFIYEDNIMTSLKLQGWGNSSVSALSHWDRLFLHSVRGSQGDSWNSSKLCGDYSFPLVLCYIFIDLYFPSVHSRISWNLDVLFCSQIAVGTALASFSTHLLEDCVPFLDLLFESRLKCYKLFSCQFCFFFWFYLFNLQKEGDRVQAGGVAGRERGRNRIPAEQEAQPGTWSQASGIMTWAKGRRLSDWATQAPQLPVF